MAPVWKSKFYVAFVLVDFHTAQHEVRAPVRGVEVLQRDVERERRTLLGGLLLGVIVPARGTVGL